MPFRIILLFLCLFVFFQVDAGVSIGPEPAWKLSLKQTSARPDGKDISGGYFERLVEVQHHVGLQAYYNHVIREMVSSAGVQNGSEISVSYEPAYQKVTFHKIVVVRDGKQISKLTPGIIKTEPLEKDRTSFIYNGTNIASVILDDIRKGDLVEYSYTVTGSNPVFEDRLFGRVHLYSTSAVSQLYFSKIIPAERKFYVREKNNPVKPKISRRGGTVCYEWELLMPVPYKFEDFEPSWFEGYPYAEFSEFNTWKEVVNLYIPMFRSEGAVSQLASKIKELKEKAGGNLETYATLATRFVQEDIRYTGIEIGVNSHRPYPPATVMKQRYGDCKDKSLLLCELLRGAGLSAYPALVNTLSRKKLSDVQPSPTVFDHAIVYAEIDGIATWIDPTVSHQRGRIINAYIPDYGKALLVKEGESGLRDIPKNYPGSILVSERFKVRRVGEAASLEVITRYSLSFATDIRRQMAESSQSDLQELYLEYYRSIHPSPVYVEPDTLFYQDDEKDNVITLTERYTIENIWQRKDSADNTHFVEFYPPYISQQLRKLTGKTRVSPVSLSYPFDLDYSLILELPESWNVKDDLQSVSRDAYSFDLSSFYDSKKHIWTVSYQYKNLKDFVEASDFRQYQDDVRKIADTLGKSLTWNPDVPDGGGDKNHAMLFSGLLVLIFAILAAYRYYRYSLPVTETEAAADFSGWVVVLGIGVVLSPLVNLIELVTSIDDYISMASWSALSRKAWYYRAFLALEWITYILIIVAGVLIIFLYFRKRNTFRQTFIATRIYMIVFSLISTIIVYSTPEMGTELTEFFRKGIQTLLGNLVWLMYVYRSQQVRETFVLPYAGLPEKEAEAG